MDKVISKQLLIEHYQIPWESEWLKQVDNNLYPIHKLYRNRMLATIDMIDADANDLIDILDIGCGVGIYDFNILKKFPKAKIVGIDISMPQIELATKIAKEHNFDGRIVFSLGDIENLEINNSFDYIMCTEVIEHLPDPTKAIDNIVSFCDRNTKVIISVPQLYNGVKQEGIFYKQIMPDGREIHTQNKERLDPARKYYSYYHTFYDERKLKMLLSRHGLRIEKMLAVNFSIAHDYTVTNNPLRIIRRKINNLTALMAGILTKINNRNIDIFLNKVFRHKLSDTLVVRCIKTI